MSSIFFYKTCGRIASNVFVDEHNSEFQMRICHQVTQVKCN